MCRDKQPLCCSTSITWTNKIPNLKKYNFDGTHLSNRGHHKGFIHSWFMHQLKNCKRDYKWIKTFYWHFPAKVAKIASLATFSCKIDETKKQFQEWKSGWYEKVPLTWAASLIKVKEMPPRERAIVSWSWAKPLSIFESYRKTLPSHVCTVH